MALFDVIGEVVGRIFLEAIPAKIAQGVGGNYSRRVADYRTDEKKYIQFDLAHKLLLTWGNDTGLLKSKLADGLKALNEDLDITAFQFTIMDEKTVVQPPKSVTFFTFHFLVRWLARRNIKTIGFVEAELTTYTTYSDPKSDALIGETDKPEKFFISLREDYSKTQFLRINSSIKTVEEYNVAAIERALAYKRQQRM